MSAQPDRGAAQDERALFEATVIAYLRSNRSYQMSQDEIDGHLARSTFDNEDYVRWSGQWWGWQARASLAASPASQPVAPEATQGDVLAGRIVSVDVSTGDDDFGNRIFAELTGETGSDGTTLIAIETSRNFVAPTTVPDHSEREAANAGGLEWISVKDRLPKTDHECTSRDMMVSNSFFVRGTAVDGGEGFGMADFQEDGKWHCYGGDYDFMHLAEVTYYLPIRSATIAAGQEAANVKDAAQMIVRDVCELDYTGGEWDAEKMLSVTVDDLRLICERNIAAMAAAPSSEKGGDHA